MEKRGVHRLLSFSLVDRLRLGEPEHVKIVYEQLCVKTTKGKKKDTVQ